MSVYQKLCLVVVQLRVIAAAQEQTRLVAAVQRWTRLVAEFISFV